MHEMLIKHGGEAAVRRSCMRRSRRQPEQGRRNGWASTATRLRRKLTRSRSRGPLTAPPVRVLPRAAARSFRRKLHARRPFEFQFMNGSGCTAPCPSPPCSPSPTRPASSNSPRTLHANWASKLLSTGGTAKLLADERPARDRSGSEHHRLPGNDGRPREDAAPARSTAACWRGRDRARARGCACKQHGIGAHRHPRSSTSTRLPRPRWPSPDCTLEDAIENIDIGGPAMVRSRGQELEGCDGRHRPTRPSTRSVHRRAQGQRQDQQTKTTLCAGSSRRLQRASAAVRRGMISNYLSALQEDGAEGNGHASTPARQPGPPRSTLQLTKVQDLRYGENSHQSAALYRDAVSRARLAGHGWQAAAGQGAVATTTSLTLTPRGNA